MLAYLCILLLASRAQADLASLVANLPREDGQFCFLAAADPLKSVPPIKDMMRTRGELFIQFNVTSGTARFAQTASRVVQLTMTHLHLVRRAGAE